jgi:ceramide glucosyltransferase
VTTLSIILFALVVLGGGYHIFSLVCVLDFFNKSRWEKTPRLFPGETPAVSVLKPIKGIDPSCAENLASFLAQDYPRFEVLFGFRDAEDPALPFVAKMAAAAPCDARVVVSDAGVGTNLKALNLQNLAEAARYPMLALSDSDMVVDRDYLSRIAGEYLRGKRTGIVTSLYKTSRPASIGSALESLTIALDFIPSVLVARRMEGITFGLGASILISKDVLCDIGGFAAIADYLADDYQLGYRCSQKGYENVLSAYVVENRVGPMGIGEHLVHQLRWARTYRASRPKGFVGYGITHIFPFALMFFLADPGVWTGVLVGLVLALRYALALLIQKRVIRDPSWPRWLFLLPVKDVVSFFVWLWSFAGSKVYWRGTRYRVAGGGKMIKVGDGC